MFRVSDKVCRLVFLILVACLAAFRISIASSQELPDEKELRSAIEASIPIFTELKEITVEVSESTGNKVEPNVLSRVKAKIALKEDTFKLSHELAGKQALEKVRDAGSSGDIYYIAQSALFQGKWHTTLKTQGEPFYSDGQPKSSFPADALIAGSSEEKAFIDEVHRQEQEAQRQQAEEDDRIRKARQGSFEETAPLFAFSYVQQDIHVKSIVEIQKTS